MNGDYLAVTIRDLRSGPKMIKLTSSSCQIAYWQGGKLRIANYLTRRTFSTNPATLEVIRFFTVPRTIRVALVELRPYSRKSVTKAILQLINAQLLLEHGSAEWKQDQLVRSSWESWLPEGGFHFMTKDTPYVPWDLPLAEQLKLLPMTPPPPQFKTIRAADAVRLPTNERLKDTFFEALHARRTHREFGTGKISLASVSRLLQTTWGVQGYFDTDVFGMLPYKTSPSGGSRHPGEVYLMALRVAGLERGLYHYQPQKHRLARLPGKTSPRKAST